MTDIVLAQQPIYQGWLDLVMLRLRLGGVECERPIVDHVSGAAVLAYDPDRRVAMTVRQTRDAVLYLGQSIFRKPLPALPKRRIRVRRRGARRLRKPVCA
jgi:hypothetical protein